jgi:hypothetical protein
MFLYLYDIPHSTVTFQKKNPLITKVDCCYKILEQQTVNSCLSDIQASRILIQPAEIANKSYRFYKSYSNKICRCA